MWARPAFPPRRHDIEEKQAARAQGDVYASGEFRAHLAQVYTKRAVTLAASRAK